MAILFSQRKDPDSSLRTLVQRFFLTGILKLQLCTHIPSHTLTHAHTRSHTTKDSFPHTPPCGFGKEAHAKKGKVYTLETLTVSERKETKRECSRFAEGAQCSQRSVQCSPIAHGLSKSSQFCVLRNIPNAQISRDRSVPLGMERRRLRV